MRKSFDVKEFRRLIKQKDRVFDYSVHTLQRARERLYVVKDKRIPTFEKDILNNTPYYVEEDTEKGFAGHKRFTVYYPCSRGGFSLYAIELNELIVLITILRTTKDIHKKIFKEKGA